VARLRTTYRCTDCGASAPKWVGRCPTCTAWNTLVEEVEEIAPRGPVMTASLPAASLPVPLCEVDTHDAAVRPTGVDELDRVLGGGLVPGSVTLVGGEPGIGKSTLLLQGLAQMARAGVRCLQVSAEESGAQVRTRAERLGPLPASLLLQAETALPHILAGIDQADPDVCVIDSIQTVWDPEIGSSPGSILQVRECAHVLTRVAKDRAMACMLVGHVTKDGTLAGPRVLEHLVDTVLAFEGDRHHSLRLLRASKHRFGPTGELGLFEMGDAGLTGVPDPSGLLLGDRRAGGPGSVVVPAMEGRRPLLVEVQALVTPSALAMPRRSAQGLDAGRLSLLLAVLQRHVGLAVAGLDVYVSAVGGVRIVEPAADLGVALALSGAVHGEAIPGDVVALAEVGLGGELRQVHQTPRRLAEAARLGFARAIVAQSAPDGPSGLVVHRAATLADAIAVSRGLADTVIPARTIERAVTSASPGRR
jgi:DNA repair protein RadA/Sms